jgi:hypothetical protein
LIGLDISEEMLRAAEHPVREEQISAQRIRLVRANIYLLNFLPEAFHFIYSLGMFGNGCPLTVEICNKFYDWLVPGGKLFFNIVDFTGLPLSYRFRRRVRELVYPLRTRRLQSALDEREARHPFFGMTRRKLEALLRATRFSEFTVAAHDSPLWGGRHLECMTTRS